MQEKVCVKKREVVNKIYFFLAVYSLTSGLNAEEVVQERRHQVEVKEPAATANQQSKHWQMKIPDPFPLLCSS
jgi:hypothetical protein